MRFGLQTLISDCGIFFTPSLAMLLLLQCGDVELNPGPTQVIYSALFYALFLKNKLKR